MKEKINRLIGLGLLFLMLWGGMMVWKQFSGATNPESMTPDTSFQLWFWLQRSPDLAIQAGLIFAGALGIATLLPGLKDKGNKGERNDRPPA